MGLFKKQEALYIDSMNVIKKVTVAEQNVKFSIGYWDADLKPEQIPEIVADFIQLYGIVKPQLDKLSEQREAEKTEEQKSKSDDTPIDLSEIPF